MKKIYGVVWISEDTDSIWHITFNSIKDAQNEIILHYEDGRIDNHEISKMYVVELVPVCKATEPSKITFKKVTA